ncbi:MAG: Holliday junction branch migration protein RuvA [bacterium]
MLNYLKGTLVSKTENGPAGYNITIEINNIGYLIHTNKRIINSLPDIGQTVIIYVSLIHKEDTMYFCGFNAREDRDLFNILQSVSGIGTKVALLLLDEFRAYDLVSVVIRKDDKTLSRTKGIGPKLAQRIILELKDKMTNWREKIEPTQQKFDTTETSENYLEAESVLLSLGYSRNEAIKSLENALSSAKTKNDSEELLRLALQWLAIQ